MKSNRYRIGVLIELPNLLREFGIDPRVVALESGIDQAILEDPEAGISFSSLGRLLHNSAVAARCPHLGLLIGGRAASSHLGSVGAVMRHAASFGQALTQLCILQPTYVRGAMTYLAVSNHAAYWGYAMQSGAIPGLEVVYDTAVAVGASILRELAGELPKQVLLSRPSPVDTEPYRKAFGTLPRFDAEQSALVFSQDVLAKTNPAADRNAYDSIRRQVRRSAAIPPLKVSEQCERILRTRLLFAQANLSAVAADLDMHPRTLNRRLAAEGTTFRQVLATARYSAAQQLLAGTKMGITEIATVLGYSDTSSFTHAFQIWTKMSPSAWRALEAN